MMKYCLAASLLLVATNAMANPFDAFVGKYSITGAPVITKAGQARECVHFGFLELNGFLVTTDTAGYNQSHMLRFINSSGWYGHPVMDFQYSNEFGTGGSSAKTVGSPDFAKNDYILWGNNQSESTVVSIQRIGNQYALKVEDSYSNTSGNSGKCTYEAKLVKN